MITIARNRRLLFRMVLIISFPYGFMDTERVFLLLCFLLQTVRTVI